jgi:hypothetical protein
MPLATKLLSNQLSKRESQENAGKKPILGNLRLLVLEHSAAYKPLGTACREHIPLIGCLNRT